MDRRALVGARQDRRGAAGSAKGFGSAAASEAAPSCAGAEPRLRVRCLDCNCGFNDLLRRNPDASIGLVLEGKTPADVRLLCSFVPVDLVLVGHGWFLV